MKKILFCCLALAASVTWTSCDDIDNNIDIPIAKGERPFTAYILNEGSFNSNNSSITGITSEGKTLADVYYKANNKKLGDTAQDLINLDNIMGYVSGDTIYTNGLLFVSVSNSMYIACLKEDGTELFRHSFSESEGMPRYLAIDNRCYIYVSLYSGKVARFSFNETEFVNQGTCDVRLRPEEIAVVGDYLLVANTEYNSTDYTYGNVVSVIDRSTFRVVREITVDTNPNRIIAGTEGRAYVCCWDYNNADGYSVIEINTQNWSTRTLVHAEKMAYYNGHLYFIHSITDWATYTTTNTFFSYDIAHNAQTDTSFLVDAPSVLNNANIYMLEINPYNGDIYIATTDYYTNAVIYQFDTNGHLKNTFDAGGLNANTMIFWGE